MSGWDCFKRQKFPTKVQRDSFPLILAFALLALGIGASLLFVHYGWVHVDSLGP
jgi:hypothetical protein